MFFFFGGLVTNHLEPPVWVFGALWISCYFIHTQLGPPGKPSSVTFSSKIGVFSLRKMPTFFQLIQWWCLTSLSSSDSSTNIIPWIYLVVYVHRSLFVSISLSLWCFFFPRRVIQKKQVGCWVPPLWFQAFALILCAQATCLDSRSFANNLHRWEKQGIFEKLFGYFS